ncbi:hypothetical protein CUZ93_1229 [Enterococcus xinjiangensis]|nr:hypothetical protein [Enterococcus lactis]MBL5008657.1 hypothetical protein [Enterococcus lactis]MBL5014368.1 hypothetical protein [Enterococcus lactis]
MSYRQHQRVLLFILFLRQKLRVFFLLFSRFIFVFEET